LVLKRSAEVSVNVVAVKSVNEPEVPCIKDPLNEPVMVLKEAVTPCTKEPLSDPVIEVVVILFVTANVVPSNVKFASALPLEASTDVSTRLSAELATVYRPDP
jgi:hypothetical protein